MILRTQLKLLVLPILLLLVGSAMGLKMFPLYSGGGIYNADPSYAYLFNGLLLLAQKVPHHIDHPGTPLQTLIAILAYGQWYVLKLFNGANADVVVAVMAEPERYLLFISRVLLVLNGAAVLLLGKKVYQHTSSIIFAMFCQCSLLTYGIFGTKLLYPAPEALIACLSLCMLAVLTPFIFDSHATEKEQTRSALLTGLIFGIGFATKLTFLPMAGLFLLLKTWRQVGLACAAAIFAWLLGILPMISKLPGLFNWAYNMLTHTGKYGGGSKGLIDYGQIQGHFNALVSAFPFFYFALVAFAVYLAYCLGAWILQNNKTNTEQRAAVKIAHQTKYPRTIAILLTVCVVQTLIVLKHFGQHYMIAVLPIAFIGIVLIVKPFTKYGFKIEVALKGMLTIVAASLVFSSSYSALSILKTERIQHNRSVARVHAELAKHPNPLVIGSYGCYLPQCGLLFGIEYAPAINKKMGTNLANFFGFNVWNSMLLIDGHGFYPLSVLQPFFLAQRPVFLLTQTDFPAFDVFNKDLVLEDGGQKLYKINGVKLSQ